MLLREVIVQNPFKSKETGRSWAHVGEIITAALQDENFEVDARRCRERTMLLLDYYKKQDFASLRRYRTHRGSLRVTLVGHPQLLRKDALLLKHIIILTLIIWLKYIICFRFKKYK